MIMEVLILIISQITFSFSRTLNVRYTAKENIFMTMLTGVFIKLTWLISSAIGIKSILELDYLTAIIYVASGMLGDYLSFKIKVK